MSLAAFATDVIIGVAELLHSRELYKLCLTGDKALQSKIRQAWRNLDLEVSWNPRRAGLASILGFLCSYSSKTQRVRLRERHPRSLEADRVAVDWTLLPPTLIELVLDFNTPAFVLPELTLTQLWPLLQTLVIPEMEERLWLHLPQNLATITSVNTERIYNAAILGNLPQSLRKLVVHSPIKCRSQSAIALRHLSLETVSLILKVKEPLSWRCFPPSLTSLSIKLTKGETTPPAEENWSTLFPSLSVLEVPVEAIRNDLTGDTPALPHTLTKLTVPTSEWTNNNNLQNAIRPISSELRFLDGFVVSPADLPFYTKLEHATLEEIPAAFFDPSVAFTPLHTMTSLKMGELNPEHLTALPQTLTSLSFIQVPAAGIEYLLWPQSLKSLSISSNFSLNELNFDLLPASLTDLALLASCYIRYLRKGSLQHLTKLFRLTLCSYFKGGNFFKTSSDFPPSLRELICTSDDQGALSELVITNSNPDPMPNRLVEIHLGSIQRRLDLLQFLPETLQRLTMCANYSEVWAELHVRCLPPNLEVLKASGAKGWFKNTAKPLRLLPPTLRVLDVGTRMKPNDFDRFVPTFLSRLDWNGISISTQYMVLCDARRDESPIDSRCGSSEVSDCDSISNSTESPRGTSSSYGMPPASSASNSSENHDISGWMIEYGTPEAAHTMQPKRRASSSSITVTKNKESETQDLNTEPKAPKPSKPSLWERFAISKGIKVKKPKSKK